MWENKTEDIVEELVEILAPAYGHRGGGHAVLEQQAGRDSHRRELSKRGVGIGVGRSGNRYRRGQFGVTDRGQTRSGAGYEERDDHRRPGLRHRLREHNEDPGTDGLADTEHRQQENAKAALQLVRGAVGDRGPAHRTAPQHLPLQARRRRWHGASSGASVVATPGWWTAFADSCSTSC